MYTSAAVVTGFTRHAHNDYLQFACEFGLVFAAVLGAVVLASLWTAIRAQLKRRDPLMQGMGFAATMAIVALLIHSAVDFNLQIPANAAMFVVMLALGWVCRYWDPLISRPTTDCFLLSAPAPGGRAPSTCRAAAGRGGPRGAARG